MKLKKPLLLLITLMLVLCLPGIPPAAADYIGPRNRTTTTTTIQHLRVCYNASGSIECTCVSDGGECGASSNPCPNSRCVSCDEQEKEVTKTTTLPNATVSANLTCTTVGSNGWCRGGPNLALAASEPVSGYRIQYIEGSTGVLCDPTDAANVNCNWTPPQGQTTLSYWAHSTFGDTSLQGSQTISVDTGNPGINLAVPTPNGQNGWFISPVTISATASDSVSGVASTQVRIDSGAWQAGPLTVSAQGTHTAQAQATDRAGNNATSSAASFKIDSVAPDLVVNAPSADGQNGWYLSAPTISLSGSDATSGLAATELQVDGGSWQAGGVTLSTDGNHTLNFRARDNAGNLKTASGTYPVDQTDPQITVNLIGTAGQNGWYRSAVSAAPAASDATSGLAALEARLDGGAWRTTFPLTLSEGVHTLESRAADRAGNLVSESRPVRVDVTPPSLTATIPQPDGQNGWYTSAPVLKVSGNDAISGLASAQIKVGSGAWVNAQTTLTQEGSHTITFQTTDVAGNTTTQTAALKVDLQGPALLLEASGTPGQNGWYTSTSVEVASTTSDAVSGLSKVEARVDGGAWQNLDKVTVSGDGAHQVEFRATDQAGNLTQHAQTVRIDAAPPQVDITIDAIEGLLAWFRSAANVSAKAVDETSGIARMDIRVDAGDWQPVNAVKVEEDGIHQLGFRAVDKAGNRTELEKEVKIDQHDPIGQFVEPVGGTKVQGTVDVSGTVHDNLSGTSKMTLSLDDGKTWQPVPIRSDGSWSAPWDTLPFSGGMHALQATFTDQAGNTSSAKAYYIVANALPEIDLTERWYIWEKGLLEIRPGDLPLMDVTIVISDPKGRWPDVHLDYSPRQIPNEIVWNRKFGQILAPIGEYHVTVKVTDSMAQQVEEHAVIVIPPGATPTATQTLAVTATRQPTATPTATRKASPTPTASTTATAAPTLVIATQMPEAPRPATSPWTFVLWLVFLAGFGTLAAFAWSASRDPRPRELKKLSKIIEKLSHEEEQ